MRIMLQTMGPDWEIDRKIGEGGVGEIFLLKNTKRKKFAVMKCMENDKRDVSIIRHGCKCHVQMKHPNILDCYHYVETVDTLYLFMEYFAHAKDLNEWFFTHDYCLSEANIAYVIKKVANALMVLHKTKHVHRDVKMENVMMDITGKIKLFDFDFVAPTPINISEFMGSLHIQAPEQLYTTEEKTRYDRKTGKFPKVTRGYGISIDNWALGILVFELLFCETPFLRKYIGEKGMERNVSQLKLPNFLFRRRKLSAEIKEFISHTICFQPQRWTLTQILQCKFISKAPEHFDFAGVYHKHAFWKESVIRIPSRIRD